MSPERKEERAVKIVPHPTTPIEKENRKEKSRKKPKCKEGIFL
jgi:hypothetical protein